jgi:hypothetical protein
MTARFRKERSGTSIRSKPETATPSKTNNVMANRRKRRLSPCRRWKEMLLLFLFLAVLLSSIKLLRSVRLVDWDGGNQYLAIDQSLRSRPSSASLAYRQSYGLFNDISDFNWGLMQQRAQRAHEIVEQEDALMPDNNRDNPSSWYPNDLEVSP